MFELSTLLVISTVYLALVFTIGLAAEKNWLPQAVINHPMIYTLSLGGYVGAWAIFGIIELARNEGYTFLAYYFGTSALFFFSPLLLKPLLNLSRTYRLSSLADLFSFRYSSQLAGVIVSLGTLVSIFPLIALQISSITESAHFLTRNNNTHSELTKAIVPVVFCLVIAVLSLRFGTIHHARNSRHDGLIVATAFQSLVKLSIFLGIGIAATYNIFGSPLGIENWLKENPETIAVLNHSLSTNSSRTLMLIFFAAALSFPHMYHLAITENRNEKSLDLATWAFPLYLLLLSLPILPILWAGQATDSDYPSFFLTLAIGEITAMPGFTLLAYVCSLAAASSSTIVIIISVASMCLNHFVLPYYSPQEKTHLYGWLRNTKRLLMIALIALSYISYKLIRHFDAFNSASFAAYTAAFQFLPGILACFYWPKGNRTGLIAGLIAGFITWAIIIIVPMLTPDALGMKPVLLGLFNLNGNSYWIVATIACLGFNMLVFGMVSLAVSTDEEQRNAAELCSQDNLSKPTLQQLSLVTVNEFISVLSPVIGEKNARHEIENALTELNMQMDETRPFALRLLRRQIESNLSGLFGPTVARQLVAQYIPYQLNNIDIHSAKDIQLIEHRLEHLPAGLSGLAYELDSLRRYHRNTIEHLPIGVCTLNSDNEILMWNQAMAELTHIDSSNALSRTINSISLPWSSLFLDFIASNETEWHNHALMIDNQTRWFTLHKTCATESSFNARHNTYLLEDVTALVKLEHDLVHNERLASIGRLAAGVAHEIGNPITGIACLAQNLKYDSDKPEVSNTAKDILAQTQRVTRILQSLINFSHAGTHGKLFHPEAVNLFSCAEDAIHLLSLDQHKNTNAIHNLIHPEHTVSGHTQRLLQVFVNLLNNALDACTQNPHITLESLQDGDMIELLITDNGSGIAPTLHDQIFEPFFTTKEAGEGTGLGLSVVYSIIEKHNGHISVQSPTNNADNTGTSFSIRLPGYSV